MEESGPEKKESNTGNLLKYSGLGFQMLATIGIFAFIGYKIDLYQKHQTLLVTAIFSLIGVLISLYQVIKVLGKK